MTTPRNKQALAIAITIAVGLVLAALILTLRPAGQSDGHDEHEETAAVDHGGKPHHEAAEPALGPHGGKLFVSGGYGLEVTIFEQNVAPHFRLYAYQDGKPLAPGASQVSATVERLRCRGGLPQGRGHPGRTPFLQGDAAGPSWRQDPPLRL